MVLNLTSYSPVDFIPYTREIYYSLLANSLTSQFSIHLLTVFINFVWIWAFVKRNLSIQFCSLALLWFICGYYFYGNLYAQINWIAPKMSWACYIQSLVCLAFVPISLKFRPENKSVLTWIIFTVFVALGPAAIWPVYQVMDWNALGFPGLNSTTLWLLTLSSYLSMPSSKSRFFAMVPTLPLIIFNLMRFYVFHVS
jgi:hypothetical protein